MSVFQMGFCQGMSHLWRVFCVGSRYVQVLCIDFRPVRNILLEKGINMFNKVSLKFAGAIGMLAMLLIFLGVNFVPRISALTSSKENVVNDAKYAGSDTIERQPAAAAESAKGSDSQSLIADNPELSLVRRYAEERTLGYSQPSNNFAANPELALVQRFAANAVKSEVPLYKTLEDNPELILSRRYTQEHNR
jgi:hypothetical protein